MIILTQDQLKAMEVSAPLLVQRYRELMEEIPRWKALADVRINILERLVSDCIYTIRSGVLAAGNVEALSQRAKDIGAHP